MEWWGREDGRQAIVSVSEICGATKENLIGPMGYLVRQKGCQLDCKLGRLNPGYISGTKLVLATTVSTSGDNIGFEIPDSMI